MKRKENDLPNLHEDIFQPLIFRGVKLILFDFEDILNESSDVGPASSSQVVILVWTRKKRDLFVAFL